MRKVQSYSSWRASSPMTTERTLPDAGYVCRLVPSITPDLPEDALCTSKGLVYRI